LSFNIPGIILACALEDQTNMSECFFWLTEKILAFKITPANCPAESSVKETAGTAKFFCGGLLNEIQIFHPSSLFTRSSGIHRL